MIICYFQDFDTSYFNPYIFSGFILRDRLFVRLKNQSVRLVQVAGPLTLPVFPKLMIMSRQESHILQSGGSSQFIEPHFEEGRALRSELTDSQPMIISPFLEF